MSISNLVSGPVASRLPSPVAWPLFLVFRDCRLTPLNNFAAVSQPPGWRLGLWHPSWCELVGFLLFLVFRDYCLTPLKSSVAASSMASGPVARLQRLFAWRCRWLCASPTRAFFSVPRLLLDPPQKFRCSFPTNCSSGVAAFLVSVSNLASGPVASNLPSPLARPPFPMFRDCRLTPLNSFAAVSQPTGWHLGLWHPAWYELVGLLLFLLVFRDCCLTSLKSFAAASSMVSGPVARLQGLFAWRCPLIYASPARALFLGFRDYYLTSLKSFAAASQPTVLLA